MLTTAPELITGIQTLQIIPEIIPNSATHTCSIGTLLGRLHEQSTGLLTLMAARTAKRLCQVKFA